MREHSQRTMTITVPPMLRPKYYRKKCAKSQGSKVAKKIISGIQHTSSLPLFP